MECFKELNMFAMKQPRKLSNQESQRFENFRIQAPKSKGWWKFTVEHFRLGRFRYDFKANQTNEITFRLNYIKICSYNGKYIVKAMPPKLDSHNPLFSDYCNKECTCNLYKYAIDSKLENLFSFGEFTVWAYSDLMWY